MIKNEDYLILTSIGFLIPTFYGLFCIKSWFALCSYYSSIISILHWNYPDNKIITNIDIKTQTAIGVSYVIIGRIYITTPYMITISYFNLLSAITCFTTSCYMHKYKISRWYYFHIFFHIFVIFNKIIFYLEM
jgi:hypothetical protein